MGQIHSTAACNAATNAVTALLGSGAKLKFRLSGTIGAPGTVVSTLTFGATPFASAVGGVALANAITQDSSATGNATAVSTATLETSGGTIVVHCSVAAGGGGDINLTNTCTIGAGDIVTCSRLQYAALVDKTSAMLVGMNVNPPLHESGPVPFADLMLNAVQWQDSDDAYKVWENQPGGLISGNTVPHQLVAALASSQEQLPGGTYTVRNPGGASLKITDELGTIIQAYTSSTAFTFTGAANQGIRIWCNGNMTQKVTVLLPGHVTSYDAGDITNSAWASFHANTQVLRTMDMLATNTSVADSWSDQPATTRNFPRNPVTGMPVEYVIAFANKLNKPLWLNVPARATDAWCTSCANLVLSNLTSSLPIYLEYGNEIWNVGNAAFAAQTRWVDYLTFTKMTLTVAGAVITKTAHGYSDGKLLIGFYHKSAKTEATINYDNSGAINSYYYATNGQDLYVKVLTANTFELWDSAAFTGNKVTFPASITQNIFVDPAEAGKTVARDTNFAARSKEVWDIFRGILGSSRVKSVLGTFNGDPPTTAARMAVTGVGAATDYVSPAPYFFGITQGAAIDRSTGAFLGKFYTTDSGTSTCRMSVYAAGSTPRRDQIKAGTGTGLVSSVSWTATYSGGYTNAGSSISGLSNGTSYLVWFCVTDSTGYDWFWSQTVAASASSDTVDVFDTYANQSIRAMLDYTGAVSGASDVYTTLVNHKSAAQAVNANTRVFCYEAQNHQSYSRPAAITTWWDGWQEDWTYADILKRYLNTAAAADAAGMCLYSDVNVSGPWGVADSHYDTTDARYVAVNTFKGLVPKRSVVNFGTIVDGGMISADPGVYPTTFYTFPDATMSYSIVNGDNEGNYQISGADVQIVATTGINFATPTSHTLKTRATDGFTDDIFDLRFFTGYIWFGGSALYAMDMTVQASAASLTQDVGTNPMTRSGTGGTLSGGLLQMGGAASWSANPAFTTFAMSVPVFIACVIDKASTTQSFAQHLQVGTGPSFKLTTQGGGPGNLHWELNLTTETFDVNFTFAAGKNVYWIYYDPAGTIKYGTNQTTTSTITLGFSHVAHNLLGYVEYGNTTGDSKGSVQVASNVASETAAKALVAKMQTLHSIP